MNQRVESDIDNAHQTLKNTKAKMREVLAQIAAIQVEHGEPLDSKVSIIYYLIYLLGLMERSHSQSLYLPITARLL